MVPGDKGTVSLDVRGANPPVYVIPSKEDVYTVTFVTEGDPGTIEPVRDQIVKTLRVKG